MPEVRTLEGRLFHTVGHSDGPTAEETSNVGLQTSPEPLLVTYPNKWLCPATLFGNSAKHCLSWARPRMQLTLTYMDAM